MSSPDLRTNYRQLIAERSQFVAKRHNFIVTFYKVTQQFRNLKNNILVTWVPLQVRSAILFARSPVASSVIAGKTKAVCRPIALVSPDIINLPIRKQKAPITWTWAIALAADIFGIR